MTYYTNKFQVVKKHFGDFMEKNGRTAASSSCTYGELYKIYFAENLFLLQIQRMSDPSTQYLKGLLFHNILIHYHTILHFDELRIYSCGKHCEKKEKLLEISNSSFSHNVFYPIWHLFPILNFI